MREGAPGANDCFRPPEIPIEVYCAHCQHEFDSYLIHWVEDSTFTSGGYWACPTPGCDGKGFTFDIWPTDPNWTDEQGNKVCFFDDDDEVDEDWAADLADPGMYEEGDADDSAELASIDDAGSGIDVIEHLEDELLIPEDPANLLGDEDYAPLELDDEMTCDTDDRWNLPPRQRISDTLEFHSDDDFPF